MTYACLQMFMEKLNKLINCNDNPLINNPSIVCERPQFQLLYHDLASLIQTLFINQHQHSHELEIVNELKKRFADAVEEAQYIVDLFLSVVHNKNNEHFPTSVDLNPSLNLNDVRRSLKSIKVELMSMNIDSMKMDISRRPAQEFISRSSLGSKKLLLLDEIVVGLDRDAELIRDKLVEDQKKVDVVSIVGMGGIGKTTLATKVFNDGYVKHHFFVRIWVTVSQSYDKRGVLILVLESIRGQLDLEEVSDSRLRELVHKHLMGKRYLIVIDDIWHTETWDNLKLFFPHDNNGSRILLTSRHTEVAKHANSDGLVHHLEYLSKEKGWELLSQKVFHGNECPEWSVKPGMQIVENCHGLPLAMVVIAGVLTKEVWSEKFWVEISERTGSYVLGDQNGCMETLALSYSLLPLHLRECFLYIGGFPEDYMFHVRWLIWLWVAEGFIEEDGNRSLEDIAESYLMDLIDRNLVDVADSRRRSNGAVRACEMHDLVRELCLKKAKEERFILQTERLILLASQFSNVTTPPYKPIRMFVNENMYCPDFAYPPSQSLRSILLFSYVTSLGNDIAKCFRSFVLLRVLDLHNCSLDDFPKGMELLVHLRYLAIWSSSEDFPSSICNLWNLQTLVYIKYSNCILLPSNISDLVNLRHLWSYLPSNNVSLKPSFGLPSIEKPMNLQSISGVQLVENSQTCFPYIKELRCTTYLDEENDFKSLTYLEKLKLTCLPSRQKSIVHDNHNLEPKNHITFPATLKTLTLESCGLPWSNMSIIQSLPNLQVLKLHHTAFEGSCWNTNEQEFPQLKFLRLEWLNIKLWEANSISFPCLRQLEISYCIYLEEIPLEVGDVPTLEVIKIKECRRCVGESARRIQEEQHDLGNNDLKVCITEDGYSQFLDLEIFCCNDLEENPLEIGDIPAIELIKIMDCSESVGKSVRKIQQE